jgi:hypothetical protein
MFGSLLLGLYHHFLAVGPDHIRSQHAGGWDTTFVLTACLLLSTEAIGTDVGIHFSGLQKTVPTRPLKPESTATIVLRPLPSLERNSFRVPDQVHGQEHTEKRIECQAKTRPPVWHTRVVDQEAMDEVKNAVSDEGSDY